MSEKYLEYNNEIVYHPGYFVAELIEDYEISQNEFARRIDTTPKTISRLINGETPISNSLAYKIATISGTSIEFWENLQNKYDNTIIKLSEIDSFDKDIEVLDMIDYSFFSSNELLDTSKTKYEKVKGLRQYLKIVSLDLLREPSLHVQFRSSGELSEKNIINSNVWLQVVINESFKQETSKFDHKKLRSMLPELRELTIGNIEENYRTLIDKLASVGVVLVLLPHLANSGINGVTKWISKDKVIVGLNDKRKYADIFWFSLFHELGHVLQGKTKTTYIDGPIFTDKQLMEEDADVFARNTLIPEDRYKWFIRNKTLSNISIYSLASELKVSPGIIVGRLQHDKHIKQNQFNDLRSRFSIDFM